MDSHEEIKKHFKLDDSKLGNLLPFEISPKNKDYLKPDKWEFVFDEKAPPTPDWWRTSHENACWAAFRTWKKEVYAIMNVKKLLAFPHPFRDIRPPNRITKKHLRLLAEVASVWGSVGDSVRGSVGDSVWDSVGDSVWCSVWGSVGDSVWDSVGDSVWDSVGDSVRGSVGDSVWCSVRGSVGDSVRGSVGNCFNLKREEWKHTKNIKTKGYPFACYSKLWNMGLVPSFDGKKWRLHGGKDAKVLWEGTRAELKVF